MCDSGAMYKWIIICPLLLVGCEARFLDQRSANPLVQTPVDAAMAPVDLAGRDLAGVDLATPVDKLVAQGSFMGRAGHAGSGDGMLYRTPGGVEVRFAANFSASGVPGPAVFLTSRDSMGGSIDSQADISLGTLKSTSGMQVYPVPAGADVGRRNVFVYCQPFRVEVAKATLVNVP